MHTSAPNMQAAAKFSFRFGEDIRSIQARFTIPFKLLKIYGTDYGFVIQNKPVIVENTDPQHGFILPATLLVMGEATDYKVKSIDINPQLKLLTLPEVIPVLRHLVTMIDQAGWCREIATYTKLEDLPAFFADPNSSKDVVGIMDWWNGTQNIQIVLSREVTAPKPPVYHGDKQDLFLIKMSMGDYPNERASAQLQKCPGENP